MCYKQVMVERSVVKGSVGGESVTLTPVFHDRRSNASGSPEISVGKKPLPDGRQAVGVQGYTVDGAPTPAGESIVTIPKSVLLEGAARVLVNDIATFTSNAVRRRVDSTSSAIKARINKGRA